MGGHISTPEDELFATLQWSALLDCVFSRDIEQNAAHSSSSFHLKSSDTTSISPASVYADNKLTSKEWQVFLSLFIPKNTGGETESGDGDLDSTLTCAVFMCTEMVSHVLSSSSSFRLEVPISSVSHSHPTTEGMTSRHPSRSSTPTAAQEDEERNANFSLDACREEAREWSPVRFQIHHCIIPVLIYLFAYWRKRINRHQCDRYMVQTMKYQELFEEWLSTNASEGFRKEDTPFAAEEEEEEEEEEKAEENREEEQNGGASEKRRQKVWRKVKGLKSFGVEQFRKTNAQVSNALAKRKKMWNCKNKTDWMDGDAIKLFRASTVLCRQVLLYHQAMEAEAQTENDEAEKTNGKPSSRQGESLSTKRETGATTTHSASQFGTREKQRRTHHAVQNRERELLCADTSAALYAAAGENCFLRVCAVLTVSLCAVQLPYETLMDAAVNGLRPLWREVEAYVSPTQTSTRAPEPSDWMPSGEDSLSASMLSSQQYYAKGCQTLLGVFERAIVAEQLAMQATQVEESHSLCAAMDALRHQLDGGVPLPLVPPTSSASPPLQSKKHAEEEEEEEKDRKGDAAPSGVLFSPSTWDRFRSRYVGQDVIWEALRSHFSTLDSFDAEKPTVILLFGPSGFGKSELAKCLASSLHGIPPEELEPSGKLVHIHMPSFCTADSIYSLVDPPAAHVGDGILLSALLQHPDAVVVLEEFEKSTTAAVQHLWLSAFQKSGTLRSLKIASRSVKTTKATFVLTCNLVASSIEEESALYLNERNESKRAQRRQMYIQQCRQACRQLLGDPFVNRVDFFFPVMPYTMEERERFVLLLLERLLSTQRKKGRCIAVSVPCVRALASQQLTSFHAVKVEEIIRLRIMSMVHYRWSRAVLTAVKGVQKEAWEYVLIPVHRPSPILHSSSSSSTDAVQEMDGTSDKECENQLDTPCSVENHRIYWNDLRKGTEWLEGWFPPDPFSRSEGDWIEKKEKENNDAVSQVRAEEKGTTPEWVSHPVLHEPPKDGVMRYRHSGKPSPTSTDLLFPTLRRGESLHTAEQKTNDIRRCDAVLEKELEHVSSPCPLQKCPEKHLTHVDTAHLLTLTTEKEMMLEKENKLLREVVMEKEIETLKRKVTLLQKALGMVLLSLLVTSLLLSFVVGFKVVLCMHVINALILIVVLKVPLRVLRMALSAVFSALGPLRFFLLCCLVFLLSFIVNSSPLSC